MMMKEIMFNRHVIVVIMSSLYQTGTKSYSSRKSKTYDKGRVCKKKNCEKTLSMYNKKDWCYNHAPISYGRNRGWIDPNKKKGNYVKGTDSK